MANTALSTLTTRTLDNLGRASTGTTRSGVTMSSLAIDWANTTQRRMAMAHDFAEHLNIYSASTTASTKTYTLPSNLKVLLALILIDGTSSVKLVNMSRRRFDYTVPYPESLSTGRPIFYSPYGSYFDLYPIPDAIYTLNLRCADWPDVLTASVNLIGYSPDKDDLVVAGMTAEGFRHLQMFDDASLWDAEFKRLLKIARDTDSADPDWAPFGIGFDSARENALPGEYWNSPWVRYGQ